VQATATAEAADFAGRTDPAGRAGGAGGRRWAAYAAGAALAVAVPVLAFQGVDVWQSWELVRGAASGLLLAAALSLVLAIGLRAWRWQAMLACYADVRTRSCLSATCVGYLANNLLPFRLGELVRARSLKQLEGVSTATALGTLAVERVADVIALTILMAGCVGLSLAGEARGELVLAAGATLACCAALILVLCVGYRRQDAVARGLSAPLGLLSRRLRERVRQAVKRFLAGLRVAGSYRQLGRLTLLSLGVWAMVVVTSYFVGQSLGLGLTPAHYTVVMFAAAFAAVIPAAPGAVGTFHGLACLGLYLVGVRDAAAALAFAALLHGLDWLLVSAAGAYFLIRDGLGFFAPRPTAEPAR
jgi:uncharacterized protein (TIRG00374 family)